MSAKNVIATSAATMFDWGKHKDLKGWENIASERQKFYYEFFKERKWETYEQIEYEYLKVKIGYALYGPPVIVKDLSIDNFYSVTQKKKIDIIFNVIKNETKEGNITLGFIFVISSIHNKYTEFPVIRLLKKNHKDITETSYFIDSFGNLYKTWDSFLRTNSIPYSVCCYPKDGFYHVNNIGEVELDYRLSPGPYLSSKIISGVSWAVGSAFTTILPHKQDTKHQPAPLISVIKGILGNNKSHWIPVANENGSSEVYAVHFFHMLAESSQDVTKTIPRIIFDALEKGYIKISWYAILNQIPKIIQNSIKTTNEHIAQVIASILFFCHSVLTTNSVKNLIKEIRSDINRDANIHVDNLRKILLDRSLCRNRRIDDKLVTMSLNFISEREEIVNSIIDKTIMDCLKIPDLYGRYFTITTLLENIGNSQETKKYACMIANYCLVLEDMIQNCSSCNKILQNQDKFIECLKTKLERILLEENEVKETNEIIMALLLKARFNNLNNAFIEESILNSYFSNSTLSNRSGFNEEKVFHALSPCCTEKSQTSLTVIQPDYAESTPICLKSRGDADISDISTPTFLNEEEEQYIESPCYTPNLHNNTVDNEILLNGIGSNKKVKSPMKKSSLRKIIADYNSSLSIFTVPNSLGESDQYATKTPGCFNDRENEDSLTDDWLIHNILNVLVSPVITPLKVKNNVNPRKQKYIQRNLLVGGIKNKLNYLLEQSEIIKSPTTTEQLGNVTLIDTTDFVARRDDSLDPLANNGENQKMPSIESTEL